MTIQTRYDVGDAVYFANGGSVTDDNIIEHSTIKVILMEAKSKDAIETSISYELANGHTYTEDELYSWPKDVLECITNTVWSRYQKYCEYRAKKYNLEDNTSE